MKKRTYSDLLPLGVILLLLILWEAAVRIFRIPLYVLPAPTDMFETFFTDFPTLAYHALITLGEACAGILISLIIGITVGILMDAFPMIKKSIYPILVVTQTVPVIVLAPIFIIYLGFGLAPKILTVVLMCFFPIVVSFSDGMTQMNQNHINLLRSYGGSRWQIYRLVKIPSAMISLLSGLKMAATYSISGAVVGEWIASEAGLGYYLIHAKNMYMLDSVFACVLMIVLLSLMMNGLVRLINHIFMPRHKR